MNSIVSISEAARLTGKSRRTIQRHVASGALSKSQDDTGRPCVQINELLRVYGPFVGLEASQPVTESEHASMSHVGVDVEGLKKEIELLQTIIAEKQDHINSLKKAMQLLDYDSKKSGNLKKTLIQRIFGTK